MSFLFRALFNGSSKHKKLSEEWATIREPVVDGVTFYCKYLGSTLVDDPKGEAATAEAIKRIIHAAKQVARKPERVALHVSLQGIKMEDSNTSDLLLHTSIYKISYCSADAHYDHVFAFIATNDNDTCECHAFLCPKRKMAQAVTISIAQAFNLAYEYWKMSVNNKDHVGEIYAQEELPAEVTVGVGRVNHGSRISTTHSQPSSRTSSPIPIRSDFGSSDMSTSGYQSSTQALLIDFEDSSEHSNSTVASQTRTPSTATTTTNTTTKPRNAFDDLGEFNDGFSRLALSREHPTQLPGTSPMGWSELDLAAFTGPHPASPTGSGFWPLASSPPTSTPTSPLPSTPTSPTASFPTSPTASSPTDPGFFSEARSPITDFLHSCQSPPNNNNNNNTFHSFVQSGQQFKHDQFFPSGDQFSRDQVVPSDRLNWDQFSSSDQFNQHQSTLSENQFNQQQFTPLENQLNGDQFFPSAATKDQFDPDTQVNAPAPPVSPPSNFQNNPFVSSQDHNPFLDAFGASQPITRPFVTPVAPAPLPSPSNSCGAVQPTWGTTHLFRGSKGNVMCS